MNFTGRIVLCYPVQARHIEQIRAAAPNAEVVAAGQEQIAELLPTADIFCGHAKVPVPWPQVVEQRNLQWIQSSAAGLDHCLVPEVIDSSIPVTSASGVLANQVAEHTVALLFGLLRGLPMFMRARQVKEFIRRPTRDLFGATVGIVGLGGVGRRIAQVLKPFHCTILATDWFCNDKPAHVEQLLPADALHDMLARVDIVILSAPLTDQTRHMIDAGALVCMRRGSLLVNVARGPLVVEHDMIEALRSGRLAAAAMDVTEVEPLPPDSPLWTLPNVLMTPHVGGQSKLRIDNMTQFFCENLRRYQQGEPLMNLVDKRLGFPGPENRFSAANQ